MHAISDTVCIMSPRTKYPNISPQKVREIWDCDYATGILRWRITRGSMTPGTITGISRLGPEGYRLVHYLGKSYLAHRVVWAHAYERWPVGDIDHINRRKGDNRLVNLQETTRARNLVNKGVRSTSRTQRKGVYLDPRDGRVYAYLDFNKSRIYLGCFATTDEAYAARLKAELQHYGSALTEPVNT